MIRLITSPAGMVGQRERISAAVPVTIGAAKLVPCTFQYPPPDWAPTSWVAGAVTTVSLPVIEPDQSWLLSFSMPATAITPGSRAGYHTSVSDEALVLPVQATTTTSLANA